MSCELRILDFNYAWQVATDVIATTESPDFPASNMKNQLRAKTWRSTSPIAQGLVFDIKTAEEIDSIVLVFDAFLGVKLTNGATIKVQASSTNSWAAPAFEQAMTVDNDNLTASLFLATAQEYRFWRIYIDDPLNPWGYIEIPKVILAKATQLSQTPDIGFVYKIQDQSKNQETDYGHSYSDIYPNRKGLEFNYTVMTEADIEALAGVYDRVGNVRCIALSLDSTENIFDKDRFFVYGKLVGSLDAKHKVFSYFDSALKIEETF